MESLMNWRDHVEISVMAKIFVILGEDPGSSVHGFPMQIFVAGCGSRLKAGMTK
jgi:hypothetical protein